MPAPRWIRPQQQSAEDCAIVALSVYLDLPYAQIAAAVAVVAPRAFIRGMWSTEIRRVAALFEQPLRSKRKFRIADRESGILVLQMPVGRHAAVLFEGTVVNPSDGMTWNYAAYLKRYRAKPVWLLVPNE